MKEIVVNGVEYVEKCNASNFNIVVLDRGFVYIGDTEIKDNMLFVSNAKNIRIWGTSGKGLGFLADGPTNDTRADDVLGVIQAPLHAVIHLIAARKEKWI